MLADCMVVTESAPRLHVRRTCLSHPISLQHAHRWSHVSHWASTPGKPPTDKNLRSTTGTLLRAAWICLNARCWRTPRCSIQTNPGIRPARTVLCRGPWAKCAKMLKLKDFPLGGIVGRPVPRRPRRLRSTNRPPTHWSAAGRRLPPSHATMAKKSPPPWVWGSWYSELTGTSALHGARLRFTVTTGGITPTTSKRDRSR